METQSAALAFAFGLNYEFGKRTVRSMSNEQFNSLTSEQIAEMSAKHSEILLQRFILAVPKVLPMQQEIFRQYVTIEKMKVQENVNLAKWMLKFTKETIDDTLAHAMGGHIHPDDSVIGIQDTNIGKDFSPDPSQGTYDPYTATSKPPVPPTPAKNVVSKTKRYYVTYNYKTPSGQTVNKNSTLTATKHQSTIRILEKNMIEMSKRKGQSYVLQTKLLQAQYVAYSSALSTALGQHWQIKI